MRLAAIAILLASAVAAADLGPDLLTAARKGQTQEIAALLAKGAPVESAAKDGRTALMIAAQRGHAAAVKLLLDRGANPAARDREGWTAYALALTAGRDDVLRVLPRHDPLLVQFDATWSPDNLYSSCFLNPEDLARQVTALHPDLLVAAAVRDYRAASGKDAVDPIVRDGQFKALFKVRPGVSCVQQQNVDNLNLAIDVSVTRATDDAVVLRKTFGGGLKGLHARAVSSPAQYDAIFSELAKSNASQIYWAVVEACLRAP
jgi:hypothetical protein